MQARIAKTTSPLKFMYGAVIPTYLYGWIRPVRASCIVKLSKFRTIRERWRVECKRQLSQSAEQPAETPIRTHTSTATVTLIYLRKFNFKDGAYLQRDLLRQG